MLGGVVAFCVVAFVVWLAFNAAIGYAAVRLEFLEPRAPNDRGGFSHVRLRVGPSSNARATHVLLGEKSLKFASAFLVGLYPVDIAEVRVDHYKIALSWGLRRLLRAMWTGGVREKVAPKLTVSMVGVRVAVKGNGTEAWKDQKETIYASIESMNHTYANQLTVLLDRKTKTAMPTDNIPPSALYRLIDGIINTLDIEVKQLHFSLASEDHLDNASCCATATATATHLSSMQHYSSTSRRPSRDYSNKSHNGWVLGVQVGRFRMFKKCGPTEETQGVTPRTLQIDSFDVYFDAKGTSARHGGTKYNLGGPPAGARSNAAVRGFDGDRRCLGLSCEHTVLAERGADHHNMVQIESIIGTLLLPNVMCVILAAGRQPEGKGKIFGVYFEEVKAAVLQLEPCHVFGLLDRVVPMLAMYGPYMDWCEETQLQWHKEAFARRGATPRSAEELKEYTEALGAPARSSKREDKGDPARLLKLDKGMSLSQIMLTRMRIRKWNVTRPERVMAGAKWLLDTIDPFQGISPGQLAAELAIDSSMLSNSEDGKGVHSSAGENIQRQESSDERTSIGSTGDEENSASDEKVPLPVLSAQRHRTLGRLLALDTTGPEEEDQLGSALYFAAQEMTEANADEGVLMEIDLTMTAKDVIILVYHPSREQRPREDTTSMEAVLSQDNDDADAPPTCRGLLTRKHGQISIDIDHDMSELSTLENITFRNEQQLPPLLASNVIEDFGFSFNMLLGSVAAEVAAAPAADGGQEIGLADQGIGSQPQAVPTLAESQRPAVGTDDTEKDGVPVESHVFSDSIFSNARPIRLYVPCRVSQGADLRLENLGTENVTDGTPYMGMSITLGGMRITDYGALEEGRFMPTLIGGPVMTPTDGGANTMDGDKIFNGGGTSKGTIQYHSGGLLEIGLNFTGVSVVALPDRILAILDVVLACVMGPPAARQASEMEDFEAEVAEEKEEEATGGYGAEVLDRSARMQALDAVRNSYLYFGRWDARSTIGVEAFTLVLPQDTLDARTNIIVAQCSTMLLNMQSQISNEDMSMEVGSFSVAPCVQMPHVPDLVLDSCRRLLEAGVAVALRGALSDRLDILRAGFPLKDLALVSIPQRQIILPVSMKLKYSTCVTLRSDEAPEADTKDLIGDMIRVNTPAQPTGTAAFSGIESTGDWSCGSLTAEEGSVTSKGNEEKKFNRSVDVAETSENGEQTMGAGLYVKSEVTLHVSSGLQVKVTDLDLTVLKGIATSLMSSLNSSDAATAPTRAGATSGSLHYALDKTQRRMIASLRQAFRRADINGDGTLDREEVEGLLRDHLEGNNLDVTQKEAEIVQFISLLDEDGTNTLDIDEFTSTMTRLMTHGPDGPTLERARRHALTKAFKDADIDDSGTIDVEEMTTLLRTADPVLTRSELKAQADRFMLRADQNGDGSVDLEEFLDLVHSMRTGNPHEGPISPQVGEYRSWEVIKPMLEGFDSLDELLASRPADYSPPGFWELFEKETHASKRGPEGQATEIVQAKMVKTFDNYSFAHHAWSFLVAPAWYTNAVRVGLLTTVGGRQSSSSSSAKPQQMVVPVRPGALVYAQEEKRDRWWTRASSISGMRIQRLPDELASPLGDKSLAEGNDTRYVTGVRLPASVPASYRATPSLRCTSTTPVGMKMVVDRPCTLLVCFHEKLAVETGGSAGSRGGMNVFAKDRASTQTLEKEAQVQFMELPSWATEMNLQRTSMKIPTILPGEDGFYSTHYVYRVFSTRIEAGVVELGPAALDALPYFVLLFRGEHLDFSRALLHRSLRLNEGHATPHLSSIFRKGIQRNTSGLRINGKRRSIRRQSAMARVLSDQNRKSSQASRTQEKLESSDNISRRGGKASTTFQVDTNPSWRLSRQYNLGAQGRGMKSIASSADTEAGKAAHMALKIAAISTVSSVDKSVAFPGGTKDDTQKPRVRVKVTLLCEKGVFLQMDDIYRLENTPGGQVAEPTFELAFKRWGQGIDCPKKECSGEMIGFEPQRCDRCDHVVPLTFRGNDELIQIQGSSSTSVGSGLTAMLDFEHVSSTEMFGEEDSFSMDVSFGIEGRYFNPRVLRCEHFIEPWSMSMKIVDPRGASGLRGTINAERHFVLNFTTGLATQFYRSILEMQDYTKSRYSTTSVYTGLIEGARHDDGSRFLVIENHLGVVVTVSLEENTDVRKALSSRHSSPKPSRSNSVQIAASSYEGPETQKRGLERNIWRNEESLAGAPADRISCEKLSIPNAKKALLTATVTVEAEGFQTITGVPLDLLGRRTHVYKMIRVNGGPPGTNTTRYEGMVVKFNRRPAEDASVFDLAMQLQTNVFLKNDKPRPLCVALGCERQHEPNTMVPVDEEVCLPFPLLHEKVLRLWQSPHELVGGETLKRALESEIEASMVTRRSQSFHGDGEVLAGRTSAVDAGKEVSVPIPPATFDRKAKVVERHSKSMLEHGVSVERTDLAPTPELVMHSLGDKAPALWRLYVRSPYVVQNGLACNIVLWASQPAKEPAHNAVATPSTETGTSPDDSTNWPPAKLRKIRSMSNSPTPFDYGPGAKSKISRLRLGKSWRVRSSGGKTPKIDEDGNGDDNHEYARAISNDEPYANNSNTPSSISVSADPGFAPNPKASRSTRFKNDLKEKVRRRSFRSGRHAKDTSNDDTHYGHDEDSLDDSSSSDEDNEDFIEDHSASPSGTTSNDQTQSTKVLWVLKSGEEVKLEGMDLTRPLHIRVGFASADGIDSCSDWCEPYKISGRTHTDRTALNKLPSEDAVFKNGARGSGGARRPEFKFSAIWEHTPGNRHIHVYSKVWVVNKTGVSFAYCAPKPPKEDDQSETVAVRRPGNATYRTDSDTILFSRYLLGSKIADNKSPGGGDKGDTELPIMLNDCVENLKIMPYAMATDAVDTPMYLSGPHLRESEEFLPCISVDGAEGDASGELLWPIYRDDPKPKISLPQEVVPVGVQRVHLMTASSDANVKKSADKSLVSFVSSRDCRVYVGVDNRLLEPNPGPPKWLALQGFKRCTEGDAAKDVNISIRDLAPQGFGLYSRFYRGLSTVLLGFNVDADGHAEEGKNGKTGAMYFVVVVRVPEEEAVKEVDVGPIVMHRDIARILDFRSHHRWRLKPDFEPGDPCYTDEGVQYTVTELPAKLRGLKLMHIVTAQGDCHVKDNRLASFQVLQNSRVLVCFDGGAKKYPKWLGREGFRKDNMFLPASPEGSGQGYIVFAKTVHEGDKVRLGGNKARGAKLMYICLVHAHGDQAGRISAPPTNISHIAWPPAIDETGAGYVPTVSGGEIMAKLPPATESSRNTGSDNRSDSNHDHLENTERTGGAVVESKDDQVFRFWDEMANGKLVQAPLDLDRDGRGWSKALASIAAKTTGEVKPSAGRFGVTVEALTGAFLKTRVVTVWPRFVVRNDLGRNVMVIPTQEYIPKSERDSEQGATRTREEEPRVLRAAREVAQPVHGGASVALYDFADLDNYKEHEHERDDGGSGSGIHKHLWKQITRSKEGKLPCVRLLSGKKGGLTKKSDDGESGRPNGSSEHGSRPCGQQWVNVPTVAVLLESIGKDRYVWMAGETEREDVLVRVSCRMLPNRATIHMVLSDETPSPPLRIENRSPSQMLVYRLEGGIDHYLEPMRWNALHWINDDKRYIEAAVYMGKRKEKPAFSSHRKMVKLAVQNNCHAVKTFVSRSGSDRSDKSSTRDKIPDGSSPSAESSDAEEDESGSSQDIDGIFSSSRWGSWKKFGSFRKYEADVVGRLSDLVAEGQGGKKSLSLQVECLRPFDSVVTTVLAFSDTSKGVYGKASISNCTLEAAESLKSDGTNNETVVEGASEMLSTFARVWTGVHFDARFAGMVLNIIDSTVSGPSELAAFTVDKVEFGKAAGSPRVLLTVWHYQLDDMRADSPHQIVLAPLESGFNSHMALNHVAAPAMTIELERDVKVSLMHHMLVMRSIEIALKKVRCAVHVDFWIGVQDIVSASLNVAHSLPEVARVQALKGARLAVNKLLEAPASDATVDRIYIGSYIQEEFEVDVEFHLGTKVVALLTSKPAADGDEEKDEGGFGSSLAMMPLGAAGGVVWGLLSSIGAGIANVSSTFKFVKYEQEHYYGSLEEAVWLVGTSLFYQGFSQAYKVLGHIDILGDPLSLGQSISSGVIGFVTETGSGNIAEGSKVLIKGVVGGTAGSISKMTGALDNAVRGAGGLDAGKSGNVSGGGLSSRKGPEHLGDGMVQGAMIFGTNIAAGVTGVVSKPLEGAKKDGALGFAKGVGQGVVGLIAAPASAILGSLSTVTESIQATTILLDDKAMGRRREPRHPIGAGERNDRNKVKKKLRQKKKEKEGRNNQRKQRYEEIVPVTTDDEDNDSRGYFSDDEEEDNIDTQAEAGGMGLLLVPLTSKDMRTNYPKKYLEIFRENAADEAGATAITKKNEEEMKHTLQVLVEEETEKRIDRPRSKTRWILVFLECSACSRVQENNAEG